MSIINEAEKGILPTTPPPSYKSDGTNYFHSTDSQDIVNSECDFDSQEIIHSKDSIDSEVTYSPTMAPRILRAPEFYIWTLNAILGAWIIIVLILGYAHPDVTCAKVPVLAIYANTFVPSLVTCLPGNLLTFGVAIHTYRQQHAERARKKRRGPSKITECPIVLAVACLLLSIAVGPWTRELQKALPIDCSVPHTVERQGGDWNWKAQPSQEWNNIFGAPGQAMPTRLSSARPNA